MKNKIYSVIKRLGDILVSIIGIIIFPVIIVYVMVLKTIYKEKSPIFFKQKRIGKNGDLFTMFKFNTMVYKAEDMLFAKLKTDTSLREEYLKNKKIKNDFRVTIVGSKIRDNNIDEWPQFINVFLGNMSIIGPRPYLLNEKKYIPEKEFNKIIKVKPGMTGLWQINNSDKSDFNYRIKFDSEYIDKKSIITDLKIFVKTIIK